MENGGTKVAMSDERVLLVIPKNDQTEQRLSAKTYAPKNGNESPFIELREFWFKDGPLEAPVPTKRGTMMHRKYIAALALAVLKELDIKDVTPEFIHNARDELSRLDGTIL